MTSPPFYRGGNKGLERSGNGGKPAKPTPPSPSLPHTFHITDLQNDRWAWEARNGEKDPAVPQGCHKEENTHLLSSPGFQSFHANQLVDSLHRTGHRCNEFLLPHVSSVAPVAGGRHKGHRGHTWDDPPLKNNAFLNQAPPAWLPCWVLSLPGTLPACGATRTSPSAR